MTHKHDHLKAWIIIVAVCFFAAAAFPAFAATQATSPLPSSTALRQLRDFFTGEFAWTVSIISLVVSASMLAFGGSEFGGAARTFIFLAIIISFVVFANNLYTSWFAGAVIQ